MNQTIFIILLILLFILLVVVVIKWFLRKKLKDIDGLVGVFQRKNDKNAIAMGEPSSSKKN